jgi:hypothetical protein
MSSRPFVAASLLWILCVAPCPTTQAQEATAQSAASAAAPVSAGSGFRISGILENAVTGDPLPRCRVTAALVPTEPVSRRGTEAAQGNESDSVECDTSGRFAIAVSSAGAWRLTATGPGFRRQAYEQHDGFSSAVVLTNSTPTVDLIFKVLPNAEVEGTVLDEAGEAVRNANVTLLAFRHPGPDLRQPPPQTLGMSITDDRGHYDFADLAPGDYLISLHARPWYASVGATVGGSTDAQPSPLDVVYPPMWYPGVTDFSAATPLSLEPGDRREADFHLLPVPGFHLHIPPPAPSSAPNGTVSMPYVTELSPDGTETNIQAAVHRDGQGNWDLSGLAPGSYEVHSEEAPNGPANASLLEVNAASPRVVDLSAASFLATVNITVDAPGNAAGVQVNLVDLTTGRTSAAVSAEGSIGRVRGRGSRPASEAPVLHNPAGTSSQERSIQVPPGSYEVVLNGATNSYLAGISTTGAEASGRVVHLHAGPSKLDLHVAMGLASVSGLAKLHGQPVVAATVLLVPATLGDPNALAVLRRDQSNSDGSFEIRGVLPGAYILVAIDHGWTVNWRDPATLRRYLLGGVAIDLAPAAVLARSIETQKP